MHDKAVKFIGIDPDSDKNGYAVWDSEKQSFEVIGCLGFFDIIDDISIINSEFNTVVVVEASWKIKKSNWHGGKNKLVTAKIGKNIGRNQRTGQLFVEFCQHKGIACIEVKPMGKKDAIQFKDITGWKGRTNSEHRDAAMLVFGR